MRTGPCRAGGGHPGPHQGGSLDEQYSTQGPRRGEARSNPVTPNDESHPQKHPKWKMGTTKAINILLVHPRETESSRGKLLTFIPGSGTGRDKTPDILCQYTQTWTDVNTGPFSLPSSDWARVGDTKGDPPEGCLLTGGAPRAGGVHTRERDSSLHQKNLQRKSLDLLKRINTPHTWAFVSKRAKRQTPKSDSLS